ncbi:MAG: hypothetical protein KKA62_02330 [Nanoarchaeota archaeon]|nr:hypothetical protein [Nanoarchaeota archaeon]MBU1643672.1 hypothetical protein [Nanoarchaeota archaeon]MBU1976770.1 hypothetical protein [Nanoarchaeota archaeon]
MLFSKKELEELKEPLKEISFLKEQSLKILQRLEENQEKLSLIADQIKSLEENQNSLTARFEEEMERLTELNQQFEKRINSFRALESSASKRLFEETNLEIKSQLRSLFMTTQNYQKLEVGLLQLLVKIETISEDVTKFSTISKEIKSADFQLSHFARQLTQQDQEKLSLMRENEKLKLLISKERRKKGSGF